MPPIAHTKIRIGVEDEFFLIERLTSEKGVAQRRLLEAIAAKYSYRITARDSQDNYAIQLNKDFDSGYCCIKFDSTVNIIEVAHPPEYTVSDVVENIASVRSQFEDLAGSAGIDIRYEGYREFNLQRSDFIEKDTILKTLNRPATTKPFFDRYYFGKICSNQIHMQIDEKDTFANLARYYSLEPLIPIFFSNSSKLGVAHAFRPMLLQDAFEENYVFFGFPNRAWNSRSSYDADRSSNPACYRDYSLIVPRHFGTWEFRSADCQRSVQSLQKLVQLRWAISQLVRATDWPGLPYTHQEVRKIYLQACRDDTDTLIQEYLDAVTDSGFFDRVSDICPSLELVGQTPTHRKTGGYGCR